MRRSRAGDRGRRATRRTTPPASSRSAPGWPSSRSPSSSRSRSWAPGAPSPPSPCAAAGARRPSPPEGKPVQKLQPRNSPAGTVHAPAGDRDSPHRHTSMLAPSSAKFAGYRVEGIAGRGGMGVVYKATQLGLDRPVALKVVAAGLLGDPRIRERFLRESRAAAAIEHPNVIPIHDYGECHGRAYIAMRFVDGDDLRERVTATGPLAPEHAAAIVAHVADALDAAHDAGLVHRDVKPANILLGDHDQVYLSDFGLASHALSEGGLTSPGGWVGTMDFMAPEQIRGEPIDRRADVYALGCVLHFALTGQVAYPRETDEARLWAHLHAAPPEASRLVPGIPAAVDEGVRRGLAKPPQAAPASGRG